MEIIDFTSNCEESAYKREKETPDFHAQQNAIGWYPHHVLQIAVELHEEIVGAIPAHTTILDVGGGRRPLLHENNLQEKGIQVVSIDFEPEALLSEEKKGIAVGVDLAAIPDRFFQAETFMQALVQEGKNVPQIQARTQRLIEILQKPIHTILLSHILLYLSAERVKQILQMSLRTLPQGGTLWLMDKCKFQFEGTEGLEGNVQGFDELLAMVKNDSTLSISDDLLIPLLTQNEFNCYQGMLITGQGLAAQKYYLAILERDNRRVLRCRWAPELEEQPVIAEGQWMCMPGYAERVLKVTRQ